MIRLLVAGNEHCAKTLREAVKSAEEFEDVRTADLLTARIGQHEENSWMLRAMLS
jgi:starvation-inducible DNA-binding protein